VEELTAPPAAASRPATMARQGMREIVLPVVVLLVILHILPLLTVQLLPPGVARYAIPGLLAATIALAYLVRPQAAVLSLVMFVLFYETTDTWLGEPIKQVDELAIPAIFLLALVQQRRNLRGLISPVRESAVAVLFVLAIVSSLASQVPLQVWAPGLLLLLKGIALFYVALWLEVRPEHTTGAAYVVGGAAGLVAVGALLELFTPQLLATVGLGGGEARGSLPALRSVFFHPVMFAWFCTYIALFAHAHYVILRRRWMLAVGLFFSVGVFLSGRRRALLALAAGLVAGLGWQLRQTRPAIAIRAWAPSGIGTLVLVIVFLPGLAGLVQLTSEQLGPILPGAPTPDVVEPSLAPGETPPGDDPLGVQGGDVARVALYRGSLAVARDYFPLGAGMGRYGSFMSRVEYSPLYQQYGLSDVYGLRPRNPIFVTDTFWPQILGETGALGLAAYLVFVGYLFVSLWRSSTQVVTPLLRAFCLGALLIFVQALVESLASPMFHSPPRAYLTLATVGAALALARFAGRTDDTVAPTADDEPAC